MKIVMAAPEAAPFAKTGGLADVMCALPKSLQTLGHDVTVFLPLYRCARAQLPPAPKSVAAIRVDMAGQDVEGRVLEARGPGGVRVNLIECDRYYDREHLYGTPAGDFEDNAERFIFFSRAVLEALSAMGEAHDVIHVHDWQTALIPTYLRTLYSSRGVLGQAATILTIHNLAYQGVFWHWDMKLTGFNWELFTQEKLEFYGKINFLKGGIVFADAITTVSKTYAREIQTVEFGAGLEGVLRSRSSALTGILNGVDYEEWSPESDALIPARYSTEDTSGKAACKALLQQEFSLRVDPTLPVIGMVTRLDDGKGLDILSSALDEILALDLEIAILGSGHERHQRALSELADHYREKFSVRLAFDNRLAHLVEAGSDMFLMPSRYEPCGLNQLYSLRYGTVPIVRETGGLADTITDVGRGGDGANGFSFNDYTGPALAATVARAVAMYGDKRRWKKLMSTGMNQDWSWARAAREYDALYRRVAEKRRGSTS
jgi:starch synthase